MEVISGEKIKECPECGAESIKWDKKKGEISCENCGFLMEENMIDFSQEWREFDSDKAEDKRRVGSPLTHTKYDKGLSTKVGKRGDFRGLSPGKRKEVHKMRKWQRRISTPIERNLKLAMGELRRASSFLNIPNNVKEEAGMIYRKAAEKGLVRGRSMESVVAGALYAACRRAHVPRTLDEVSEAFEVGKKEIGKTYRFICRQLDIRILPTSPIEYVHRFASELDLTPETTSRSVEIIKEAVDEGITSGKGPMGIAAAALYISALLEEEKKTQREVADVAGVTEVTIRNRYKELLEKLNLKEEMKEAKKE